MLCEVQGIFLEIIDVIRGFGLNILKAKMERKKNKLWARFIVEVVDQIFDYSFLFRFYEKINTALPCATGKQTCYEDRCVLVPYPSSTTDKHLRH